MQKLMIITLGTGQGVENGLAKSIWVNNPEEIIFVTSLKSLEDGMADKVGQALNTLYHRELPEYDIKTVQDAEDVEDVYRIMFEAIRIFGYSEYESNGYFVGPDAQLRRNKDELFEEPTLVIKLIITNYMTVGVNYPVVQSSENPFQHVLQWFVWHPVSPYRRDSSDSAAAIRFEYTVMMMHYWGIVAYLFDQLSHKMPQEQEIWI